MNAGAVVTLAVCVPGGLALTGMILHVWVDDTQNVLWPRGLRWFPSAWERLEDRLDRIRWALWPEDRELFPVPRRTRHLEELDERFRYHARLHGVWPEWTGRDDLHGYWRGSYGREIGTCPCGYVSECGIWCGDGHETGACPADHAGNLRWPG